MNSEILVDVANEIERAEAKFGSIHSTAEGLGVLYEEFHELTEAIRRNDRWAVRDEAIQVSAVAMRIAAACDDEPFRARSGFK